MTEMLELSKQKNFQLKSSLQIDDYRPLSLVLVSPPFDAKKEFTAGPAQFGADLKLIPGVFGRLVLAKPFHACSTIISPKKLQDKILVAKRGDCMFIDKARKAEEAGAAGLVIVDNQNETSHANSPLFAMSGDGVNNVNIPSLFLFGKEGNELISLIEQGREIIGFIGDNSPKQSLNGIERALALNPKQLKFILSSKANEQFSLKTSHLKNRFDFFQRDEFKNLCLSEDYEIMKRYFDLFVPKKSHQEQGGEEEEIQVVEFDEVIELGLIDDERRELMINLNVLLGSDASKRRSEDAEKVFDLLRSRFETKTNLDALSDKLVYKEALFNLVRAMLGQTELSNEHKLSLSKFANELDFKENSTENIVIKTVKRPKNKN